MTTKTPSWNDIRNSATAFVAEWANAKVEPTHGLGIFL